jgi:hypothetical protein
LENRFFMTGRKPGLPGVELHSDRLNIATDAVLQAHRERVAAMYNRPAAFDKQASPLLGARHDRPLALIEDEYRQISSPRLRPYGPGDTALAGNLPSGMLQI